ncbi:MAG: DinB family protein [Blastocatellia bacterium]|nr:DinB family protein [Blastocatellia bacterium]
MKYLDHTTSHCRADQSLLEMVSFLQSAAVDLTPSQLHRKPAPSDFSLVEHVCHLRDLEREGVGVRIDRLLRDDDPVLPDFDGTAIALARDYNSADFPTALEAFRAARSANVTRLASLDASALARAGTQEGVGRLALGDIPGKMHEHDDAPGRNPAASQTSSRRGKLSPIGRSVTTRCEPIGIGSQ